MEVIVPKLRIIEVKVRNERVIVLEDGKVVLNLPWEMALSVGKVLVKRSKIAEERANALQVIKDQALLIRAGAPVGLTSDPEIQKEAVKEATHSRELRRALPGGIKSQSVVGAPTIIKKSPKGEKNGL